MIGIGCDIVEIARIQQLMKQEGYLKILTHAEQQYFHTLSKHRQVEWLAGRFVAKEAVFKAISTRYPQMVISQIEILTDDNGRPYVVFPDCHVFVSISHEKQYAIAYATAMKKE